MDSRTLLTKCITLVYRESLIRGLVYDNSNLVRTTLETVKVDNANDIAFTGHNKLKELKEYVLELLADKTKEYEKEVMLQRLKLLLENDNKLYEAVEQGILPVYEVGVNKRVVINIVKALNNHYKEVKIGEIIHKASYELKFNRTKIPDVTEYINDMVAQLEPLQMKMTAKDPAVIDEIDISDENCLTDMFAKVKKHTEGVGIFRLGFKGFNDMSQGGLRRGEYVQVTGLPHKYKTGWMLTALAQIAIFNSPDPIKVNPDEPVNPDAVIKRPLLVYLCFEDDSVNNVQFLYQYLKMEEGIKVTQDDLKKLDEVDAGQYIKKRLSATGFHIKIARIDPTKWSYKDIFNKVIEYEAQGYEVQYLFLNALYHIPTTGCITTGAMGTDRRDQIRRVLNFCMAKNIGVMSPHQMSNDAKEKLRNGTTDVALLKEVAEKGYYEGSKQLDQELSLDMYIHLVPHKGKTYLAVMRGKHRLPTNIPEYKKFFLLPFIDGDSPLVSDIFTEQPIIRSLPKGEAYQMAETDSLF